MSFELNQSIEGNQPFQTNVYLFAIEWILLLVHFLSYYLWGFFIWQTFLFHINGKWVLNLLQAFFGLLIRFIMVWKIVLIALIRDLFWYKKKKIKIFSHLAPTKFLAWWGWNSELAFLFRCTCLKPDVYFCYISSCIKTEIGKLYRNNTGAWKWKYSSRNGVTWLCCLVI